MKKSLKIPAAALAASLAMTGSAFGAFADDTTAFVTDAAAEEVTGSLPLMGGWSVNQGKVGMKYNPEAKKAFDKAVSEFDSLKIQPIALLATQVVSGTNYKALCRGNDGNLYAVTWYNDLQNNASFTSAECVNIGAYSGL